MPVNYNPEVIQQFADREYERAEKIITRCTILYGLFAGVIGFIFSLGLYSQRLIGTDTAMVPTLIFIFIGGYLGKKRGEERVIAIKCKAQLALAHMRMERTLANDNAPAA